MLTQFDLLRKGFIRLLNVLHPFTTLKIGPLSLHVFTDGFGSIEENIFNNVYFTSKEIKDADTIIDLGAHHCSFTINSIIKSSPGSTIIAVEPNPLAIKLCIDNIKALSWLISKKELSVKIFNRAVWDSEEIINLKLSWWSEGSYISSELHGNEIKVKAITLDNIIKLARGKTIIKMDIEGAEYRVLKNSNIRDVHMIAVEVHGDPNTIVEILRSQGFKTYIQHHKIGKELSAAWLRIKPRSYGSLIATYRFVVSQIAKPTVTIVKGVRA